mmetsp:Transcript_9765/g.17705  ORF Transcript_9765/g.17705 Transcript_9765/m.17705 type:complete len:99 (-) Transcript_9765:156-452(-)
MGSLLTVLIYFTKLWGQDMGTNTLLHQKWDRVYFWRGFFCTKQGCEIVEYLPVSCNVSLSRVTREGQIFSGDHSCCKNIFAVASRHGFQKQNICFGES